MKTLTTVSNENVTVFARFVAFVAALVVLLVNVGLLNADQGDKILGFINNPQTAAVVSAIATILLMALPAVQGWRSRDKELPDGVTTDDVTLKPGAEVPVKARAELG